MRDRTSIRASSVGTLCISSAARIRALSAGPEAMPDRQPYATPMTVMTAALVRPINRDARPPCQMMAKMSRPSESVPNQNSPLGG